MAVVGIRPHRDLRGQGPLRIVVAGEFSSGKSATINALLRSEVLPDSIGGAMGPPIRIRHGEGPMVMWTVDQDGERREVTNLEASLEDMSIREVQIAVPFPALHGVEITEVPARTDNHFTHAALETMRSADLLIWCTISSQAWRLSEKAVMEKLPRDMRARALLALTRADKLRSDEDREKIARRIEREATAFFAHHVFIAASGDLVRASHGDTALWNDIGGGEIASIAARVLGARADAEAVSFLAQDTPERQAAEPQATVLNFQNRMRAAAQLEAQSAGVLVLEATSKIADIEPLQLMPEDGEAAAKVEAPAPVEDEAEAIIAPKKRRRRKAEPAAPVETPAAEVPPVEAPKKARGKAQSAPATNEKLANGLAALRMKAESEALKAAEIAAQAAVAANTPTPPSDSATAPGTGRLSERLSRVAAAASALEPIAESDEPDKTASLDASSAADMGRVIPRRPKSKRSAETEAAPAAEPVADLAAETPAELAEPEDIAAEEIEAPAEAIIAPKRRPIPEPAPAPAAPAEGPRPAISHLPRLRFMADDALKNSVRELGGFQIASIFESANGAVHSEVKSMKAGAFPYAAIAAEIVQAHLRAVKIAGGGEDFMEDIVFTTPRALFMVQPIPGKDEVFALLAVDRAGSNVLMARVILRKLVACVGV